MEKDQSRIIKHVKDFSRFPLMEALIGRRSRRFCVGARIPDGPLAYKSEKEPIPLTKLEQLLVLGAMSGSTGWHYAISFSESIPSKIPSFAGSPTGRVFPSAAGFHTSNIFFTDDDGTYCFSTRDFAPPVDENEATTEQHLERYFHEHEKQIHKLSSNRLHIPPEPPYVEPHNTWIANHKGSLLALPVVDLAQHTLASIWYYTLEGHPIYDDVAKQAIPDIEKFKDIINPDDPVPLSFLEQQALSESSAEISISCYAGTLMLQAMGLGGWAFDGMDWMAILGASGNSKVPGFGFRYDKNHDWTLPNITGLPGVMEGFCPPHFSNMADAVEALAQRKYGEGGAFHERTPGPWKDSPNVRKNAHIATEEFKSCVAHQAQYMYDTYGKFPAINPSIYAFMYLQAHHIDLGFYDYHFRPKAYLSTHENHMRDWH